MHKIKIILLSLFGITAIFVAILAFILNSYNNQDYQQLLIKAVDTFSDYTLSIKGSFELHRSFTPELSASKIELHSLTDNTHIDIDTFKVQITLASLLSNTLLINDLLVEKVRIELHPGEAPQSSVNLLSYLPVPIIEHAQLKDVQLITQTDHKTYILDSLTLSSKDRQAPLELQGTGTLHGHLFNIKGQLGPLADIFVKEKAYPINLIANWKHAQLLINGTIKDPPKGEGLDLVSRLNIPELADIVAENMPIKGQLQSTAHLTGTFTKPELAEIQASIIDEQFINLHISGSIGDLLTQEQTDLHLSGVINDAELLKWIFPDNCPAFNALKVETDISDFNQTLFLQNVNINLNNEQGLKIDLRGKSQLVMQQQPFRFLDMQATLSSKDTQTIRPYLGKFLPEMGPVKGTAQVTTQDKYFVLADIDLLAGVDQKVQLTAKGRVGPLSTNPQYQDSKIELGLSLSAAHSSDLSTLLGIKHPEIGSLAITANLKGSFEKVKLDNINLRAGSPDLLSIQADGWIVWDKLSSDSPQQSTDMTIKVNTPSIQNAARLYDEDSPDLGAATLSMRIHGIGETLEGSGLTLKIGSENSLLLTVQGKVAQIFYADFFYKGIELTGTLAGKNTSHLSELLENSTIPDIGAFSGKFIIRGDSNSLHIPQISVSAGRKQQILLSASGKIAEIPLRKALPSQGVDIALTVTAPNSADLSAIVGSEIPDLGQLIIKGRLMDDNQGIYAIKDLTLLTGDPHQPTISMSGSVEDLLSTHGLQMEILFDEKTLLKLFDLRPVPELGHLEGSALLSNASGSMSIKDLKIKSGNSELISLKILGAIDNVTKAGQVSANVEISIKHPPLFGKLFATDLSGLGPVSASGLIAGNKNNVTFKGHSFFGRTRLTGDLALSLAHETPKITGEITSPNIFLEDFGMESKVSATTAQKASNQVKTVLFSDAPIPLEILHKVDLELTLRLFKITSIDYQLNRVNTDLLLQSGNLTISPLDFDFAEGHVTMNAAIHAMEIPEWQLSIKGDSMQLGKAFKTQDQTPPIEGDLNFIVDLKSTGISAHDIAENLGGEIGFTLENGGVSRSQLELVFLNPLGWLFSQGISGNEFHISCGLGRYEVKKGIISSKVFLIDGPKLRVRGDTEINLGSETILSVYNLEKKNLFNNSIIPTIAPTSVPIKISGNLSDPTIAEVSVPSVISKVDRYIFAPVATIPRELLGTVFGLFDGSNEVQSPCAAYLKD